MYPCDPVPEIVSTTIKDFGDNILERANGFEPSTFTLAT